MAGMRWENKHPLRKYHTDICRILGALHLPYTSKYFLLVQGSGVILGSAGQSDFYSPLLPLFSGYTKIRNSELGPVLLKFALFNGLRPLVKNVIFCSVSTAH